MSSPGTPAWPDFADDRDGASPVGFSGVGSTVPGLAAVPRGGEASGLAAAGVLPDAPPAAPGSVPDKAPGDGEAPGFPPPGGAAFLR